MNFQQLIRQRESIRSYDTRPVENDKLHRILQAGHLAPSACNRQPWTLYLISKPENLKLMHQCYSGAWLYDAPHILLAAGQRNAAWTRKADGYNSLETDLTIAMDHMILAATAEGVGTCWIANFDPEKLKQSGLLKTDEIVFALTPLGYPAKETDSGKQKIRNDLSEMVVYL
ncbi:MAG: nitroreductase [Bacteroidales bacterium]|jgi:nitroreductase|nr:nitroreductase [Candidatus Falkowbacteria bacterium]NLO52647.1 nitroreductase [Bacteroidales bacterium]